MKPTNRLQLHLATLLALTFAAGGLLWLNVNKSPGFPYLADYAVEGQVYDPIIRQWYSVGWPQPIMWPQFRVTTITPVSNDPNVTAVGTFPIQTPGTGPVRAMSLLLDLVVAFAVLVGVAILCEWILRRNSSNTYLNADGAEGSAPLT